MHFPHFIVFAINFILMAKGVLAEFTDESILGYDNTTVIYAGLRVRSTELANQTRTFFFTQPTLVSTITIPATTLWAHTTTAAPKSLLAAHTSKAILSAANLIIDRDSMAILSTETGFPIQSSISGLQMARESTSSVFATTQRSLSAPSAIRKPVGDLAGASNASMSSIAVTGTVPTSQKNTQQPSLIISGSVQPSLTASPLSNTSTILTPTISWVTVFTGTITETSTRWLSTSHTTAESASVFTTTLPGTKNTTFKESASVFTKTSEMLETTSKSVVATISIGSTNSETPQDTYLTSASRSTRQMQPSLPTVQVTSSILTSTIPASMILAAYDLSSSNLQSTPTVLAFQFPGSDMIRGSSVSSNTNFTTNIPPLQASTPNTIPNTNVSPYAHPPFPILSALPSTSSGNKRLSLPVSIRLPTIPEHVVTSAKSRWGHIGGGKLVIMTGILCGMVIAGVVGSWVSWSSFGQP